MNKYDKELELLKEQNKLLKLKLEAQEKSDNNHSSNRGFIIVIIILIAVIVGGFFYFNNQNQNDTPESYNTNSNESTREPEKQCVKWENEYNFEYCKYSVTSSGCKVTGQRCTEWR